MTENQLKEKIVEVVKREYRNGMVNMFEGNVSARIDGRYFITPSQVSKEIMTPEMLIEIDENGNVLKAPDGLKPSTEVMMHLEVYRLRPDVQAVVHNHSPYATAYALCGLPIESDCMTEMNLTLGRIPVVPYGTPGTDMIYQGFSDVIGSHCAMLLANHGLITFADDLELAYSYAEAAEKVAQTLFIAHQIGSPVSLPQQELEHMRAYGESKRVQRINRALEQARHISVPV